MVTLYKNNLKILTWNIEGLFKGNLNKLDVPQIRKIITQFDIVCLQETWYGNKFDISGYKTLVASRSQQHKNRWRDSGGIAILIRNNIWKQCHVKEQKSASDDFLWLKLDKRGFKLKNDLFLCTSYLIPEKSSIFSWKDLNVCELLEKDVTKYSKFGDIYICGDLNARTSTLQDYVPLDGFDQGHHSSSNYLPDNFDRVRNNSDVTKNIYGTWLTDLCISTKLCILNGRCTGDLSGKFTCYRPKGESVVDYHIISKSLFDLVQYINVKDLTIWSDHCPVACSLRIEPPEMENIATIPLCNAPPSYIWDENSKENFILSLNAHRDQITQFENLSFANIDSNAVAKRFSDLLKTIAKPALKWRRVKHRKKKPILGFDKTCYEVREHLMYIKTLMERYPHNRDIRKTFYQTRKIFNKQLKITENKYKKDLLIKLSSLKDSDPSEYWKLLNTLRKKGEQPSEDIPAKEWLDHFKKLFTVPDSENSKFSEKLDTAETSADLLDALDYDLTLDEVTKTLA